MPKTAFWVKSVQKMQLTTQNVVLLRFTTVCVGNWLLPNFKPLLPKNAFVY